jgi:hypothetical protein
MITKRLKKHPMTLIEVLVAFGILSILLAFIFGAYQQVSFLNSQTKKIQEDSFKKRYAQYRLGDVLPKIELERKEDGKKKKTKDRQFFLSEESNDLRQEGSLVFSFERGYDIQPKFAGNVLAMIYLDDKEQLCMGIFPQPSDWKAGKTPPMRREVLLDRVEALSFEFYVPRKVGKIVETKQITTGKNQLEPQSGWLKEWSPNYIGLPAMIKIHITRRALTNDKNDKEEITYAYTLPYSERHIVYEK